MRRLCLAALAASAVLAGAVAPASAGSESESNDVAYTFAVIGDVPYGPDQLAAFPGWIDQINAAEPRFTVHLGDVKSGSTTCDDTYFQTINTDFARFVRPLVYTPGDNEWTDCHRTTNGAYNPLERLAEVRQVFFPEPGRTLGQKRFKVYSQANLGFPENVRFQAAGLTFATLHIVGSNDDLRPWDGLGNTAPTAEQVAEEQARRAANIQQLKAGVSAANRRHDRAVVLMTQADMFDPTYTPTPDDISAFTPLVQALIDASAQFDGPIYLFNGDSHIFNADRPLAAGSPWLTTYGVTGSADHLQRLTVDGSSNNLDWLKVTVNPPGAPEALSWERVPYTP